MQDTAAKTSGADDGGLPMNFSSKRGNSEERRSAEAAAIPLQADRKATESSERETGAAVAPPKASAGTAESKLKGGAVEKGSKGGGTAGHNSKEDKAKDSEAGGEHSDSDSSEGTGSAQEGLGQSEEGDEESESSEGSDEDEGGSEEDGGQEESSGGSDGADEDDEDEDDEDEDYDGEQDEEGGQGSDDSSSEEDNFVEEGPDKDEDSDDESFAARRHKARGKRQGPVWLSAPGKLAAPDPSSKDRSTVECGVRKSWLRCWAEYVVQKLEGKNNEDVRERLTSGEVCDKVVIPETREHKCRYADLLEPGLVGLPNYFVSHTWGGKFQDLIDLLCQRLEDSPDAFVWLDLCAINQQKYADKSELQYDDISGLSDVVGKVQSTLFCLDEYGTTLSRVWCLFEVWQTIKAKRPAGLQILTFKLDDSSLEAAFMMLDVSKARASIESDRVRILREMEQDMGLAELTLSIKESFLLSTKLEAEQALAKLELQQSGSDEKGAHKLMKGAMAACEKAAQIAKLSASHDAAQAHAVKGCELFLELLSQKKTSAMSSMVGLKNCLDWDRCPSESEAIERRILDMQSKVLGPKSLHTCCTLCCLVTALGQMEGRLADAEALQEQLVAAAGPKSKLSKAGANILEGTKGFHNREEQESVLRERVMKQCQKHGPGHIKALEAMNYLATNLLSQSKNTEAKEVQSIVAEQKSKALEQLRQKKGARNIESQAKTQTMVIQLVMLGDTEGAVRMYQQMLDEVGPGSDMCRATGLALAQSLKGSAMHASVLGKHEEAEGKYTQAVQALQVPLEHLHAKRGWSVDKLELMSALAGAKSGMGRFAEAEQIQREVIGMQPKPTGIQHIGIASSMSELADTLTKQEKHEEAEHWLRQAANVYRKFMGPGPLTEMVNASLAACLRKQGKDAEARALQP